MADESGTPLRQLFAQFFVKWDTNGFNAGVRAVDGLFGKLQNLGQALASVAIIGGIATLTKHVIEQGDQLATTADRLGIATDALQEWMYAADLSDVSQEEMTAGLRIFQRQLYEAANGGKEAAEAFAKMGVQVKGANGETIQTEDAIAEIADRFAEMTDPVEKTALAMKVFGRGGQALVPLLSRGSAGVAELRKEFQSLGGGLTDETVKAANDADDAFKRLRLGVRSLISNAMLPFIKGATAMATWTKEVIVKFRELSKGSKVVEAGLIALGAVAVAIAAPIVYAWLPVIATTLAWAAALTGAVLILDDLITLFTGGKSLIGDWIDSNFGEGSAEAFVAEVKKMWAGLKEALAPVLESFKGDALKDMRAGLRDMAELVHTIVEGFKYLASLRKGKADLGDTWVGKLGKAIGFDGSNLNGGPAGVSGLRPGDAPNQGPALGETGTFNSAGPVGLNLGPAPTDAVGDEGKIFRALSVPSSGPTVAPSGVVLAPPTVTSPRATGDAAKIENIINLSVAPNAAPDPALVPMVKAAVTDALDQANRATAAGM